MVTRIEIIDRALSRIGAAPLLSEAANGAAGRLRDYDSVVPSLLTGYPWYWATRTRPLARLAAAPPQPWRSSLFQLPSDMLGSPRAIYADGALQDVTTDFDLSAEGIAASVDTLWIKYTYAAPPQFWPSYFAEVVVLALAAEFALSVREDAVLRERLRNDVYGSAQTSGQTGLLGEAKAMDGQAKPSATLDFAASPLIAVRGRGRR